MEDSVPQEDKTRLRVKFGAAEIDYEGSSATLEKLIMPTVAKMIDMVEAHADLQRENLPPLPEQPNVKTLSPPVGSYDHSTNTIAVTMNARTAPELTIAATAHLVLVKKLDRFGRKEILAEMKSAPSFFNANMPGNLSKILARLTSDGRLRLLDAQNQIYALSNDERVRLEQVLAQIN